MRYQRPAIERRVKVADPVIAGPVPVSPVTRTPTWALDDLSSAPNVAGPQDFARYERPAIERRVKVTDPVIAGFSRVSPPIGTPP